MKKIIVLLVAVMFCFTGCSKQTAGWTVAGILGTLVVAGTAVEANYNSKHNFNDYVREHGSPTSSYTQTNGITNYSFVKNCPNSYEQEEILVQVDENDTIVLEKTIRSCSAK